jgi:hypothetical protein
MAHLAGFLSRNDRFAVHQSSETATLYPKSGGWPVNLAVGLGLSSRFAGGIRRASRQGAV